MAPGTPTNATRQAISRIPEATGAMASSPYQTSHAMTPAMPAAPAHLGTSHLSAGDGIQPKRCRPNHQITVVCATNWAEFASTNPIIPNASICAIDIAQLTSHDLTHHAPGG